MDVGVLVIMSSGERSNYGLWEGKLYFVRDKRHAVNLKLSLGSFIKRLRV